MQVIWLDFVAVRKLGESYSFICKSNKKPLKGIQTELKKLSEDSISTKTQIIADEVIFLVFYSYIF